MKQTAMGNLAGMIRRDWYNNRLQPCRLHVRLATEAAPTDCIDLVNKGSVMEFSYDFDSDLVVAGVQNNGNVGEMFDEVEGISYSYTYDKLNRLKTADATGGASPWGYDYDYDAWGNLYNRTVMSGTGSFLSVTPTNNNQLVGHSYDLSGNMLASPMGGEGLVYDAENRIVQVGANITYKYDGDGNRVQKIVSGTKTIYFRSAVEGNVRKEFVDSGSGYVTDRVYAYLNGSHLASYSPPLGGGWKFTFRDHLGTLRVRTRSWGAIVSRHDFYPFGGEHTPPSADEDHLFTDQERDAETGLDYFIARHYGSNIGRFLQPDEFQGGPVDAFSSNDPLQAGPLPYASITDPRSLNKYGYTYNNPLRYTDPTGHCPAGGAICVPVAIGVGAVVKAVIFYGSAILAGAAAGAAISYNDNTTDPAPPPPFPDVPKPDSVTPDDDEDTGGSSGSGQGSDSDSKPDTRRTSSEKANELDSATDAEETTGAQQKLTRKQAKQGENPKPGRVDSNKKSEGRVKHILRRIQRPEDAEPDGL